MQLIEIKIPGMDFKLGFMKSSMLDEGRDSFDVHGGVPGKHSSSIVNLWRVCQEEQEGKEDSEEELDVVTMPKTRKTRWEDMSVFPFYHCIISQ